MNVTDEMVAAARQAYWDECEVTTGKVGMRLALEAAIALMRGQSEPWAWATPERNSIVHANSKAMFPESLRNHTVPLYPTPPKDTADEQ